MKRIHYLAAEIFFYSYDNYDAHLGINPRFDQQMPKQARILDQALDKAEAGEQEIDLSVLGRKLDLDEELTIDFLNRAKNARRIVDADSPAAGFREAVRQCIVLANTSSESESEDYDKETDPVEQLSEQICYRLADLSYLLKQRGERVEQYSEELRS